MRKARQRVRERKRELDESVPVRALLFIRALQLERSRDEIFPRTEESRNETGPFLIGSFRPIKNEVLLPKDAIARNGSEIIPIVSDESVSDVIKSGEHASPSFLRISEPLLSTHR